MACARAVQVPEKAWKKVVWSKGTKGKLTMEAALVRAKVCVGGKPIEDEEVRQGVRQMREAWEKRKGNLFVVVRDLRGGSEGD